MNDNCTCVRRRDSCVINESGKGTEYIRKYTYFISDLKVTVRRSNECLNFRTQFSVSHKCSDACTTLRLWGDIKTFV